MDKRFVYVRRGVQLSRAFYTVFIAWFLFTFLNSIYAVFGHGDFTAYFVLATALGSFSMFVVVHFAMRTGRYREVIVLTIVSLLGIAFAAIAAMRTSGIEGFEGARILTTDLVKHDTSDNIQAAIVARTAGIAGYGAMYAFSFVVPILMWTFLCVKNMQMRLLFGILAVSATYAIRSGGLGTPIAVAIYGTMLLFLSFSRVSDSGLFIIGLIGPIALLVFAYYPSALSFLASPVEALRPLFEEGSSIELRIASVVEALRGQYDTYAFARYQLQVKSFNAFLENPFVGLGLYYFPHPIYHTIGGHSMILDFMAESGIVGFSTFIFFIWSLIRYYRCLIYSFGLDARLIRLVIVYLCTFIFAGVANPATLPSGLYFLVGMVLIAMRYGKVKNSVKNVRMMQYGAYGGWR